MKFTEWSYLSKILFRQSLLKGKIFVVVSLGVYQSLEKKITSISESSLKYNPKFHCEMELVCLLCNSRLPLFWWSSGQCLEPMYAQLLSESKHRHRLEKHGDLRRR